MSDTQTERASVEASVNRLTQELVHARSEASRLGQQLSSLRQRLSDEGILELKGDPVAARGRVLHPDQLRRITELQQLERDADSMATRTADLQKRLDLARQQLALLDGGAVTDPQALLEAADSAFPFVLLPVRIETRFAKRDGDSGLLLKVRIFTDDLHAQAFSPDLDPAEAELRDAFANKMAPPDGMTPDEEGAIRDLLAHAPVTRAAWIARTAMGEQPSAPHRPTRTIGWTELLPRRWVVSVRDGEQVVRTVISGPVTDEARRLVLEPADGVDDLTPEWVRDFDAARDAGMAVEIPLERAQVAAAAKRGLDVIVLGVDHESSSAKTTEQLRDAFNGHMFNAGLRLLPQGTPTNNTSDARSRVTGSDQATLRDLFRPPAYPAGGSPDAALLERALGLPAGDLAAVARPNGSTFLSGEQNARAMATALWPVAQGYAGRELSSVPPPYGHFTRYVRARGSLPTLAIGLMPYGVIVCGAIHRVPDHDPGKRVLQQSPFSHSGPWERALLATPNATKGLADPESFLEMIKLTPSSESFRMRLITEAQRFIPFADVHNHLAPSARPFFASYSWLPILQVRNRAVPWRRGLVIGVGEQPTPPGTYIDAIADSLAGLIPAGTTGSETKASPATTFPEPGATSDALLYHLLRYGAAMTAKWAGHLAMPLPRKSPFLTRVTEAFGLQPGQLADYTDLPTLYKTIQKSVGLPEVLKPEDAVVVAREADHRPDRAEATTTPAAESPPPDQLEEADRRLMPDAALPARRAPDLPPGDPGKPPPPRPSPQPLPLPDSPTVDELLDRQLDPPITKPPAPRPDPVDTVDVSAEQRATELLKALRHLATLDEHEVLRLTSETLDATAYRRDAWVSSIHSRHLDLLRNRQPEGSFLGAYGFVLGLKPEREPIPVDGPAEHEHDPVTRGGFLAAQSLDQAATLAVIRNAYLTHASDEDTADLLRLNLDSRRIRVGKDLIDAVRNGNPPADVIGARFERLLHRRNQELLGDGTVTAADGLDQHVHGMRRLFPQRPEGTSSDEREHRVVNGIGLLEAWRQRDDTNPPAGTQRLQQYLKSRSSEERLELARVLEELEAQVDAADDLLIFEATFRTIRGDRVAATRTLDAHSGMAPPPELVGIRTPASGVGFAHRIVALFPEPGAGSWPGRANLTARLAPELNAWVETLIGDPRRIKWGFQAQEPPTITDLTSTSLSALDLVWTAEKWARASQSADADDPSLAELTQHLRVAAGPESQQPSFQLLLSSTDLDNMLGPADLTLPQIGELCLRLARSIRVSRPLEPTDLVAVGAEPTGVTHHGQSVTSRIAAAADVARTAINNLQSQLDALEAVDTGDEITPEVAEQVAATVAATNLAGASIDPTNPRRITRAAHFADYIGSIHSNVTRLGRAADKATSHAASADAHPDRAQASLRSAITELVAKDFPLIIPFSIGSTHTADLAASSNALATSVEETARRAWIQQAARVVPTMSDLELALMLSETTAAETQTTIRVSQLPWREGEPWIGGRLQFDDDQPVLATTSIIAVGPGTVGANGRCAGLLVATINDRIPSEEHTGGVAFPYDQPSARAPQAILIAVPSDVHPATEPAESEITPWRWEDLWGAVESVISEMRLRAADPNYLEGLGLALPATMFPYDPVSDLFTVDLVKLAQMEVTQ